MKEKRIEREREKERESERERGGKRTQERKTKCVDKIDCEMNDEW